MKLLLIIIGLFITGCAHNPPKPIIKESLPKLTMNLYDEDVVYLVEKFEKSTGVKVDRLDVYFQIMQPDKKKVLAYCDKPSKESLPSIVINYESWTTLPAYDKEILLFHELGHCILHRPHSKDQTSLMYMFTIGTARYLTYYNDYITDLARPTSDAEINDFFNKEKILEEEKSYQESLQKEINP